MTWELLTAGFNPNQGRYLLLEDGPGKRYVDRQTSGIEKEREKKNKK